MIDKFISEELSKGFLLPIPIDKVEELPDAEACPIYIVKQATINENGNESIKHRPCHNLSYNLREMGKSSINDCIIYEEMNSIQYAFVLWRILYFILALR